MRRSGHYTAARMLAQGSLTPSHFLLALQAVAAVASVRAFARHVVPSVNRMPAPAATLDSIGPFALALPLIAVGWRTGWNVGDATGWIVLGAPIAIMMLGFGAAILATGLARLTTGSGGWTSSVTPAAALAWSAIGGLLLLIGAAHDLTIWTGQCAFASGAVLLWMNTPDAHAANEAGGEAEADAQAGRGLTRMLLCAIAQAAAMGLVPQDALPIAGGLALGHAAMILALAAGFIAPAAGMRIAGWTAAYGVLLGLGAISLRHLLPEMLSLATTGSAGRPPVRVAFGTGSMALEATLMLALGVSALAIERLRAARTLRMALGGLMIIASALLAGWRLAAM